MRPSAPGHARAGRQVFKTSHFPPTAAEANASARSLAAEDDRCRCDRAMQKSWGRPATLPWTYADSQTRLCATPDMDTAGSSCWPRPAESSSGDASSACALKQGRRRRA
jgi:hypothetical protein